MINSKMFEHRPVSELFAIVKNFLRQLDDEGLIDEGKLIKTVLYCNEKLGIALREMKQVCLVVENYKVKIPKDFEKLYYAAALKATNTSITSSFKNPLSGGNSFDRDVIYSAELDRESFGGQDHYIVQIKRENNVTIHNSESFVKLDVDKSSIESCHPYCPNVTRPGKYTVRVEDGYIHTPFRSGELYIMYLGTMTDELGNILFPFHPKITPYYEWSLIEAILMDAVFNSEWGYADKLKLAQNERVKAWLDAYNITTEKGYGEYVNQQRRKEMEWYNLFFKYVR